MYINPLNIYAFIFILSFFLILTIFIGFIIYRYFTLHRKTYWISAICINLIILVGSVYLFLYPTLERMYVINQYEELLNEYLSKNNNNRTWEFGSDHRTRHADIHSDSYEIHVFFQDEPLRGYVYKIDLDHEIVENVRNYKRNE